MKRLAIAAILLGIGLFGGLPAAGEEFVLVTGGRVLGKLLNPDESPRERFVIRLPNGSKLTLAPAQVREVHPTRPEALQYEHLRRRSPDTVEGHWALAEWCQKQGLEQERERHLKRIIELDPDHVPARHALGYSQVQGEWKTQEQHMLEQGYRYYKGRWRTTQQIELLERERKVELAQKEWIRKINRWREWLGTDRDPEGRAAILGITDPYATAALAKLLEEDPVFQARVLYVEALAGIGTPAARGVLAERSLADPVGEVRLTCLDFLEKTGDPDVVAYYVAKLKDKDNRVVNLAAVGLARMKDLSAVGPLIEALVTIHKFKITKPGGPGSMTTTFGTGPGGSGAPGGLSVGGGSKIISRPIANQNVLDALILLTGQNFSFDQRSWRYWHAAQRAQDNLDARRD